MRRWLFTTIAVLGILLLPQIRWGEDGEQVVEKVADLVGVPEHLYVTIEFPTADAGRNGGGKGKGKGCGPSHSKSPPPRGGYDPPDETPRCESTVKTIKLTKRFNKWDGPEGCWWWAWYDGVHWRYYDRIKKPKVRFVYAD